jgi:NADH dehydrogenase
LLETYPEIGFEDTHFHLVEAMGRIMPEVSLPTSLWVIKNLAERGAQVHLDTQLKSAVGGVIELSTGESFESDLIIWTAGVMATPDIKNSDLPIEERGRLRVRADLRVEGDDGVVEGAWGAGDVSAVPDLTGGGVGGYCVPNAQHAVRQGKLLAKNIVADLRGEGVRDYVHKNMGAVAGLGLGIGVFQSGKIALKGLPAWFAHRGYHGLAMPSWERKFRVIWGWVNNFFLGRDMVSLEARVHPRAAFEEFAARPRVVPATTSSVATQAPAPKATSTKSGPGAELPGSYSSEPAAAAEAEGAGGASTAAAPKAKTTKSRAKAAASSGE